MRTRRNQSLRKTRKGGKVLGKGYFAKVIDPAIPCKDGRDMSKYVSRISMREREEDIVSKNHKKLIKKLKEIDPDQKHFYYPEYCEPGVMLEENKKDGVTYKNKKYSEILIKGHEEWNPFGRKDRSWIGFLKGKKKGRKSPYPHRTKEQEEYLLQSIKLLHDNDIIHGDLHGKNVIIANDGMPRIIDFGESVIDAKKSEIEEEKAYVEDSWPHLDVYWRDSRQFPHSI